MCTLLLALVSGDIISLTSTDHRKCVFMHGEVNIVVLLKLVHNTSPKGNKKMFTVFAGARAPAPLKMK